MITLFTNILAIVLYTAAGIYCIRQVMAQQPVPPRHLAGFALCALLVHGVGVFQLSFAPTGFNLGFFTVSSLLFWVINVIVLLSSLKKALHNLFILLFPLSALAVAASLLGQTRIAQIELSYGLASHVVLSVLAYSLMTIATLQALLLAYQNHQLRHKQPSGSIRLLPPLQTMESLLFEFLWAGQILLTLSITSGIWFLEDIFAQHLAHKSVFSLIAWFIYALLLWGRHQLGWRGYKAIRWTLGGFASLLLAYFGSKLVLEIILQRV
jgi:ABC-type uncharacterized transport system permease subunit